nr:retrovirus-related Pol polyprotein from transposon TNT 1-94 [Tanacetum cinerariifolium]
MSASMEACIARHVALPLPPLLVPSIPLPFLSPLTTSPTDTGAPLGYRAVGIKMKTLLPSTSRRTDILEADMPQRTDEFEICFEDAQDDRALLRAQVNTLFRDRPDHRRTTMLMDRDVMYSHEAGAFSMDRSSAIAAHVRTLETHVAALITQTTSLQPQLTTTLRHINVLEARDPEPQEGPAEAGSSSIIVWHVKYYGPDHRRTTMLMDRYVMYSHEAGAFSMDRSSAIAAHVRTLETQGVIDNENRISHQTSVARTPQQDGVVKRRNHTLVKAAHTIKPNLSYIHVFGALCYPTNDSKDLVASKQFSSGPGPKLLTPGIISSGLMQNIPSSISYIPPIKNNREILFYSMFNEYLNPLPCVDHQVPAVITPEPAISTDTPSSTTIDQDAPSTSTSQTNQETPSPVIPFGVKKVNHDIKVAHRNNNPYVDFPILEPSFKESSSHTGSTRHQLQDEAIFCYFEGFFSFVEPKSYNEALTESCWIEAMLEELNKFERLEVWKLSLRGIFLNQSKYVIESLKNYGMETCDPVNTLMVEKSKLDEDPQGKAIDPKRYCRMTGALMYLTSNRPDLVFVVSMCARYQAKPIEKHLYAVAKIPEKVRLETDMCSSLFWVENYLESVKISSTNVRLETTTQQKEETFQVVIDVIKNSTCFKAFTIKAEVPKIFMQQLWYTIKKVKYLESYEFLLDNKKFIDDTEVFRKTLDICLRVEENVDYPELIWEDFAFQIDHMKEKKSRRKTMPFFGFTKVIINHFSSQHKYFFKLKFWHYHTIKDDGIVNRLKFVRIREDHQTTYSEYDRQGFTKEDTVDTPMVDVDMSKESDFEPARKRSASRRVVKKKVTISVGDNIIPNPDVTLKLGCYKSEYSKEDQGDDQEVEWIDSDEDEEKKDDIDDDKSINLEMTDDEETDDEFVHDVEQTDAGKTKEVKDDAKKVLLRIPQMLRLTVYWILKSNLKFLISNLIQKFFVKPAPESSKIQKPTIDLEHESEKSALEIHKIKREEAEKQKMPKYTIKSTYKETLKEYDQKITLYQTMHENKSFNRNPANHALYHALMKPLIEDENAMDKGVADTVKNQKRQHDDDDDDDDEKDLSVRPNQGKKIKRQRTKESESSKKPSTTKETSKGKAPSKGSKTSQYASVKDPVKELITKVVMDDAFNTVGEDVFMIMINNKTLQNLRQTRL